MDKTDYSAQKRIAIFALKDDKGIADKYVEVLLKGLSPFVDRGYLVVSKQTSEANECELGSNGWTIIETEKYRDNSFYLYQQGIQRIGWKTISKYDELLLFDSSIMGPVNPFRDMFCKMKATNYSLWGIVSACAENSSNDDEYLLPFFVVVRRTAIITLEFQHFWKGEFCKNEEYYAAALCSSMREAGFSLSTYVDTDILRQYTINPILFDTKKLVETRNCPVFLKKMFSYDYSVVLENTSGARAKDFLSYLKSSGKYDIDLIWETILRTEHQEDIIRNLGMVYMLDTIQKIVPTNLKTIIIAHIYYEDLIDLMVSYLKWAPETVDILITTVSENNKDLIKSCLAEKGVTNKTTVKVIENRGRDVSSLLVAAKEDIDGYDVACFIHDKKTPQVERRAVGEDFGNLCYENLLLNTGYISRVVSLFECNKRLGMLVPPFPSFGILYELVGNEWGPNYNNTEKLAQMIGLEVRMSEKKRSMAPYGTCFWFRVSALKKLFDYNWKYDDFPEEPNKIDGTILHAIERIYPLVAQDAGYYVAEIMNTDYAAIEYQRLSYYTQQQNRRLTEIFGFTEFSSILNKLDCLIYSGQKGGIGYRRDRERKPHDKGIDYFVKDLMHMLLPKGLFEKAINEKRKIFGPFEDYNEEDDERYLKR